MPASHPRPQQCIWGLHWSLGIINYALNRASVVCPRPPLRPRYYELNLSLSKLSRKAPTMHLAKGVQCPCQKSTTWEMLDDRAWPQLIFRCSTNSLHHLYSAISQYDTPGMIGKGLHGNPHGNIQSIKEKCNQRNNSHGNKATLLPMRVTILQKTV